MFTLMPVAAFAGENAPALPTATVTPLEKDDLTFALNFKADSVTDGQLEYYGDWYADFELTVNKDVVFDADENSESNGYLSGNYGDYGWINVPCLHIEPVSLKAGEVAKVMEIAAKALNYNDAITYGFVYEAVKDFDCGVFFNDDFLTANPDLVVTLELRMYNPADKSKSYVIGETYRFVQNAEAVVNGAQYYETLVEAITAAESGDTVTLLDDVTTTSPIKIEKDVTINGNNHTLTYTGSDRAIDVPNSSNGANVTINNLIIESNGERGITYNTNGSLTLNAVTVKGEPTYAINFPTFADNAIVNIKNSSLTGNIALNIWGSGMTIDVETTQLIGIDKAEQEGYGTIQLNNDGKDNVADGTVVTVIGGSITAEDDSSEILNWSTTGSVNVSGHEVGSIVALINYGLNSYGFATLDGAVTKANAGETISLVGDVTLDESLEIPADVELKIKEGKKITLAETATLTIKGTSNVEVNKNIFAPKGCFEVKLADNVYSVVAKHTPATEWSKDATYHWKECTNGCKTKLNETVHSYVLTTTEHLASAATCTEPAKYFKTCECGAVGTEEFSAGEVLGHTPATDWTTDDKQHWKVCANGCGEIVVEKADHTFGDWTTTKEATTSEKGAKERECSVCKFKETAEIDKLNGGGGVGGYVPSTPSTSDKTESSTTTVTPSGDTVKVETETKTESDGTKVETETTTTTTATGETTKVETTTETKTDGTTVETTVTTDSKGDTTTVEKTTETNDEGTKVETTVTTDTKGETSTTVTATLDNGSAVTNKDETVNLEVTKVEETVVNNVQEAVANDDNIKVVGNADNAVNVSATSNTTGAAQNNFDQPMSVSVPVDNATLSNVKDTSKLTLAKVVTNEDGSTDLIYVGGSYDEETGKLTAKVNEDGNYILVEKADLVKIELTIDDTTVKHNDAHKELDVAPVINAETGRTELPLSYLGDALGFEVLWDGATRTVTVVKGDISFSLTIGEEIPGYGTPYIDENSDRTMVSASYISGMLGANVIWDSADRQVIVVK